VATVFGSVGLNEGGSVSTPLTRQVRLWALFQEAQSLHNEKPEPNTAVIVMALERQYRSEFGESAPAIVLGASPNVILMAAEAIEIAKRANDVAEGWQKQAERNLAEAMKWKELADQAIAAMQEAADT
jgi:hypothetical protein